MILILLTVFIDGAPAGRLASVERFPTFEKCLAVIEAGAADREAIRARLEAENHRAVRITAECRDLEGGRML